MRWATPARNLSTLHSRTARRCEFYVHGMEGVTGAATITARPQALPPRPPPPSTCSRRGWNWCRCRIRPPRSRPTRRSTCGPESCNRELLLGLPGRAGRWARITVNVTHSNADVAQLVTTAGSADSRTVSIPARWIQFTDDGCNRWSRLHPVSGGTTTVSATATGFTLIRTEPVSSRRRLRVSRCSASRRTLALASDTDSSRLDSARHFTVG